MCLGVPGKVVSITGEELERMAKVSFGGVMKDVSLAFVPEAMVDDYVIVHVGVALSVIDEAEAMETFQYLKELGEAWEEELRELQG